MERQLYGTIFCNAEGFPVGADGADRELLLTRPLQRCRMTENEEGKSSRE
jgi:hypothetical protein